MKTSLILLLLCVGAFADLEAMKKRIPEIVNLKEQGLVGEQPDGYLGVVKADGNAQKLVDAENADRKEEYAGRAKTQGQATEVLAKVLGEARIRQEKSGRFIRNASGEWVKK